MLDEDFAKFRREGCSIQARHDSDAPVILAGPFGDMRYCPPLFFVRQWTTARSKSLLQSDNALLVQMNTRCF